MSYSLVEVILAAGNSGEESAFWMQMLALAILAGLAGIWGLVKTRAGRFKGQEQGYAKYAGSRHTQMRWKIQPLRALKDKVLGIFLKTARAKPVIEELGVGFDAADAASRQKRGNKSTDRRDLAGGMELLELDFLVDTVENAKGGDTNDVTMQKLTFNELVRRERLDVVGSNTLKVYAMNKGNLYGKDIQCEAMKEMSGRTGVRSG